MIGTAMDLEFRVYQGDKVIFRALFKWPEGAPASLINELRQRAHGEFRKACPAVRDEEVEEHWAKPGEPD